MSTETFEQMVDRVTIETYGSQSTTQEKQFAHYLRAELAKQAGSVDPVAFAAFPSNGNIRIWSTDSEPVRSLAEREGLQLEKLYPASALAAQAAKIAELQDEIAKLKPDAERLDALDWLSCSYGSGETHEGNRWCIEGPFATIRHAADAEIRLAAIDAERNAK